MAKSTLGVRGILASDPLTGEGLKIQQLGRDSGRDREGRGSTRSVGMIKSIV